MTTTDRFSSMDEVRALRGQLKIVRDARLADLATHWRNIQDKDFRRALLMDGVRDLFRKENGSPGALGYVVEGLKLASGWLPVVGPLLGRHKGLFGSRLFWSGMGLALPLLADKGPKGALNAVWDAAQNGLRAVKGLFHQNGVSNERE
ncbi:MAG: hypothetical protein IPI07_02075 [Flavobacteriales bacterium]|jgi:hypothetical protein|nr:hypothetical protein [Flavobacteriales bacterium]MBK9077433.1 hypothetical protein [Flavobacteriales bacterium]